MKTNGRDSQKLVLFAPINAAGHMQSSLAIADRLREEYNYKCVFVFAGPPHTNLVEDHGHLQVVVEDTDPLYDYEIESDDDLTEPINDELKIEQGKEKRKFEGASRWPQFMARNRYRYNNDAGSRLNHSAIVDRFEVMATWMMNSNALLDAKIQELNPDLIVADSVILQPTILKEQHKRPWVRLYTPNPLNVVESKLPKGAKPPFQFGFSCYSKAERARMRSEEPDRWQAIMNEWMDLRNEYEELMRKPLARINEYYRSNGCNGITMGIEVFRIDSPYLNVYMYPEALDYDQEDDMFQYAPRWLRCDSLVRSTDGKSERVEREFWAKQIEERRGQFKHIVYFSLGSIASGQPDLMQRYIDYLSGDSEQHSDILYIISKGVNGEKVKLSSNNMIGGNYLPQTFLLELSDVAVIHGGNNSLTETMYYGTPVIVLPAFYDQPDNAQRVEDLKLGKRLNLYTCTKDQFLGAVKGILADKDLIARVRAVGERMRARDELGKVTNLLKEIVETGTLSDDSVVKAGARVESN